jgi:hypothetical protein
MPRLALRKQLKISRFLMASRPDERQFSSEFQRGRHAAERISGGKKKQWKF